VTGTATSDIGYAGYFYHPGSGLEFALFRAYDPTHARWLNRDPIAESGGINLYAYVNGNPIKYVDPTGLICTYNQTTGSMVCQNDTTGVVYYYQQGYSGNGDGKNNSSEQGHQDVGPIPNGSWTVGAPYDSPNTGPNTFPLTPQPGNSCFGTGRNCSTFRMHGDNATHTASHGCIIMPPNRTTIPVGETIRVISGDD
jgi:RHS repeat-associated protein